ncbi:hypothetical protein DMH17_13175 [Raoultella planticola]|nr:hypothetical protein [Raoultella planticola]
MLACCTQLGSLTDNSKELLSFENFDINVLRRERGVKLERSIPEEAFVDGRIIRSCRPTCSPCCAISCSFTGRFTTPCASRSRS